MSGSHLKSHSLRSASPPKFFIFLFEKFTEILNTQIVGCNFLEHPSRISRSFVKDSECKFDFKIKFYRQIVKKCKLSAKLFGLTNHKKEHNFPGK